MTTYKLDHKGDGWISIPGNTKIIVAHFKDGHTEKLEPWQFAAMGRKRSKVERIDCYTAGETIKED